MDKLYDAVIKEILQVSEINICNNLFFTEVYMSTQVAKYVRKANLKKDMCIESRFYNRRYKLIYKETKLQKIKKCFTKGNVIGGCIQLFALFFIGFCVYFAFK